MPWRILLIGLVLLSASFPALRAAGEPSAKAPVSVFAALDGTWKGEFVGYDVEGRELYRIQVVQHYRTVSETTQEVRIRDALPDGTVVEGVGENRARRLEDGTLELTCHVEKSNGETVLHQGRLVRDAAGAPALIWHSGGEGRSETFLETVGGEGEETVYRIEGLGRYGETLILMSGRYVKQEE